MPVWHYCLPDAPSPIPQMWMNAALGEAAVPSAVSTPWAVTGASVQRGTAQLRTGRSAHPGEGLPGWPQAPGQVTSVLAPGPCSCTWGDGQVGAGHAGGLTL